MKLRHALPLTALFVLVGSVAHAYLNIGTFLTINSKLYSDGQFTTSPLNYQVNTYKPRDALRCWVMANSGNLWKCDDNACGCFSNCPGPGLSPRYVHSFPDGIVNQGACDSGNCFSWDYGGIVGLENLSSTSMKITYANYDPSNGKHQEAVCTISASGRSAKMVVGTWH